MNPHLCSHSHITALAVYAVRNQLPGVVGLLVPRSLDDVAGFP